MRESESFDFRSRLLVFTWIMVWLSAVLSIQADEACRLPVQGAWLRANDRQPIIFSQSGVQGHRLVTEATGEVYTSFDCLDHGHDRYVFGLPSAVDGNGGKVMAYFCWKLVKSTEKTWLLYPLTPKLYAGTFSNYRAFETLANDTAPNTADVCSLKSGDVIPTLLYKTADASGTDIDPNTIPEAERRCPVEILANYSYVRVGSAACDGARVDFCEHEETARVNYAACSAKVLFSEGGILSCTASFLHNGDIYVMLVNHDSAVDSSQYFRFVCVKVPTAARRSNQHQAGKGSKGPESVDSATVTVYPGDCTVTSGTHQLAISRKAQCGQPADKSSENNPMVLIIAVVVGVDAAALVAVFVCLYFKAKATKRKRRMRYTAEADNEIDDLELERVHSPRGVWGTSLPTIDRAPESHESDLDTDRPPAAKEADLAADGVPVRNGPPRMSLCSVVDSEPEGDKAENRDEHITHM